MQPFPAMTTPSLPADAGHILLPIARQSIARALGKSSPATTIDPARWLQSPAATFVTLRQGGQMRGRTGSLKPRRSLHDDVIENAIRAALHDPCFSPLTLAELDDTTIEVAVLSEFEAVAVADERAALRQLRPGIDGAVFRYGCHHSNFLPEMWEQYPDPREFLAYLKYKAGVPPDFWDAHVQLHRYDISHWQEPAS